MDVISQQYIRQHIVNAHNCLANAGRRVFRAVRSADTRDCCQETNQRNGLAPRFTCAGLGRTVCAGQTCLRMYFAPMCGALFVLKRNARLNCEGLRRRPVAVSVAGGCVMGRTDVVLFRGSIMMGLF